MQKRKLTLDHLRVDTFETGQAGELRGTVRANATGPVWTCWDTCDINATCGLSCNPSCLATIGVCCPES